MSTPNILPNFVQDQPAMAPPQRSIGIDLGTICSCVAVWNNNYVEIIANDQGNRSTPSMAAFTNKERLLAEGATSQIAINPKNTIYDVKRLMGRRFTDSSVQHDIKHWPFVVVPDADGASIIEVEYKGEKKKLYPQEISSMILYKMKKIAEEYLEAEVNNVVISVPSCFTDSQRRATKDAAKIAGFKVTRLIHDSSAAALAYSFKSDVPLTDHAGKTIIVFDIGGAFIDVAIVKLKPGVFEVKAVSGDTHLGGEDLDRNLVNYCVHEFSLINQDASDVRENARAMQRLRVECNRVKRYFSHSHLSDTFIEIDNLHNGYDFSLRLTRSIFEELNSEIFTRCQHIVESCIADARLKIDDIEGFAFVGSAIRTLKIKQYLIEMFAGKDVYSVLNPDETVAAGAALQAANLNTEGVEFSLTEVIPRSLGVLRNGGMMDMIFPKNTPTPAETERTYTTRLGVETEMLSFTVYESEGKGEHQFLAHNNIWGEYTVIGGSNGTSDIKVVFNVDADGILHVAAYGEKSNKSCPVVTAKGSVRLTSPQLEKMISEREKWEKDHEEAVSRRGAMNSLLALINITMSKMRCSTVKERLKSAEMERIGNELENFEDWIDENGGAHVDEIEKMERELRSILLPFNL